MRTIDEIMDKVRYDDHPDADYWNDTMVEEAMKAYAKEVIDHILSHPEYIYVDDMEAVYSYEKFTKLKESL